MKPILIVPIAAKPTEEILEQISKLVEGIKSGTYIGYAAVGIKPGGACDTFRCAPSTGIITTVGAVACLLYDLQKRVVDE